MSSSTTFVQVAGHGTIRVEGDAKIIAKPTTQIEVAMYRGIFDEAHRDPLLHDALGQFVPRFYGSRPYLASKSSKYTDEVLLENLSIFDNDNHFHLSECGQVAKQQQQQSPPTLLKLSSLEGGGDESHSFPNTVVADDSLLRLECGDGEGDRRPSISASASSTAPTNHISLNSSSVPVWIGPNHSSSEDPSPAVKTPILTDGGGAAPFPSSGTGSREGGGPCSSQPSKVTLLEPPPRGSSAPTTPDEKATATSPTSPEVANLPPITDSSCSAHKVDPGEWSTVSTMDVKIGLVRHTKQTKEEKVRMLLEKDKGTTGPVVGVRITGLIHARVAAQVSSGGSHHRSHRRRSSNNQNNSQHSLGDDDDEEEDDDLHVEHQAAADEESHSDEMDTPRNSSDHRHHHDRKHQHQEDTTTSAAETEEDDDTLWQHHAAVAEESPSTILPPSTEDGGSEFISSPPLPVVTTASSSSAVLAQRQRRSVARQQARQERLVRDGLVTEVVWREGKSFGRGLQVDELPLAIAKFCTLLVSPGFAANVSNTVTAASPDHSASSRAEFWHSLHPGGSFKPAPFRPLVECYRASCAQLLSNLDRTDILSKYSICSSSLLFFHQCRVHRPNSSASKRSSPHHSITTAPLSPRKGGLESATSTSKKSCIEVRAQVRLVDFSASGLVSCGDLYDDDVVRFKESLARLVAMFDTVLERFC